MYARTNVTRWHPDKREAAEKLTWETIIPSYREANGFRGYLLLTEPDGDEAMAITLWETEADMEASAPIAQAMIPQLKEFIVERPKMKVYEVTIHGEPEPPASKDGS
jgi:quinol monooxygenase YgiN